MWNFAEDTMVTLTADGTTLTSSSDVSPDALAGFFALFAIFWIPILILAIVAIVGMWKMFEKAKKPGWAALIPIYNMWVLCEIAGKPGWWSLLILVPFVGAFIWFVLSIVVAMDLAKAFGKDSLFGIVALWLFSIVGYLILGFGSAEYKAVKHS